MTAISEYTVRTIDVKRAYKMGSETVQALKGVSISIDRGEYISIMGPSGSGKSTFFNMIGGLDKPSEGKVYIDEVDIAQLDAYELAWMRCHKIGYIFQTFNLPALRSGVVSSVFQFTGSNGGGTLQGVIRDASGNFYGTNGGGGA